ncbi:PD-(D/E)XK nuclease family transposase [Aerococcaceae bacterium DSM 111176]|nr:PD-(D/E)XK nuclease family transposase [Aerococcaceae bacterium DSM 111176]
MPTNDLLFKKTFASAGHEEILIGFLQDVLQVDVESVKVKQPYHIDQFKYALEPGALLKTEVDLLATSASGEIFTVEMQL